VLPPVALLINKGVACRPAVDAGGDAARGVGGAPGTGGGFGSGGISGTGGGSGSGGKVGTGGSIGTGGISGTGGGSGGKVGTGGSIGTGGKVGSGGAAPPDGSAPDVPVRCVQPVSAGDCTGQLARSCQELMSWGATADGAYRIDPDGSGANLPFVTFCEMNAQDHIGWTLMAKVNTATMDGVDEPRPWFITESHPEMLATRTFVDNQSPAAHGAYKFAPLITASSIARFEIYAALDVTQKAAWYKVVASTASLQVWFTPNDTTASKVCTDLALTLNCSNGTISPDGDATVMNGMSLNPYGYTANASAAIHMRLNDDNAPGNSGVCSGTLDNDSNKWKDSYNMHWGNGLLIWLN
jgi:hypothetical protein